MSADGNYASFRHFFTLKNTFLFVRPLPTLLNGISKNLAYSVKNENESFSKEFFYLAHHLRKKTKTFLSGEHVVLRHRIIPR